MRTNKVKSRIRANQVACGVSFNFKSLQLVELVGLLGFDHIFMDGEHGAFTMTDIEEMCMMADRVGLTPLCRVPNNLPSTILQFLDRGVLGVLGPHIVTKADVEGLVKACKFAPQGIRSFTGHRVMEYARPEDASRLMAQANDEVMVSALIEDADALKNLPEILSVEGLDVLSFGPFDLSQSMGFPGQVKHPKVVAAMEKATAQIRTSGKVFGPDKMQATSVIELVSQGGREFLRKARGG